MHEASAFAPLRHHAPDEPLPARSGIRGAPEGRATTMSGIEKAYKNLNFLNSPAARTIRMLCEYEEPRQRFRTHGVENTIVMFGSARCRSQETADKELLLAQQEANDSAESDARLLKAQKGVRLARYYEDARAIAHRLAVWGMEREGERFYVCSGGGPGIMEGANRGASEVEGGRSVALGISLAFEEKINPYATPELSFEFHYFFMRKYWFMYLAKAMIVFPGGFGTMDELFELLTLRQTGKVKKPVPTVLHGKEFWDDVLDLQALVEWGTISEGDLQLFHRSDTVDDTVAHIIGELEKDYP
jgi:uncharacterized protein (TIGR00730 family)